MPEWLLPIITASWLGILTSISPCPLATNIAAISYISRRIDNPISVISTGLLYTFGRIITYTVIGIILVKSILSAPTVAHTLQKYMIMFLGPLMIIVALLLLNIIKIKFNGSGISKSLQNRVDTLGIWGGGLLGIIFAVSFCPTSAALFFGSLLPLALQENSGILLPSIYGIGTGLPVIIFAILLSISANKVAKTYNKIVIFEVWARRITGIIFLGIGIYYTIAFSFNL